MDERERREREEDTDRVPRESGYVTGGECTYDGFVTWEEFKGKTKGRTRDVRTAESVIERLRTLSAAGVHKASDAVDGVAADVE